MYKSVEQAYLDTNGPISGRHSRLAMRFHPVNEHSPLLKMVFR